MKKKIVRKYSMEDSEMLSRAYTKYAALNESLALFTAKFPLINAAFASNLLAKIDATRALVLDNEHLDEQRVLTQTLTQSMAAAYIHLTTLGAYAKLAYPKRTDKNQRAFGQDAWIKARFNKDKLIAALDLAHEKLSEEPYKTDLPASGFGTAQIAQLATHAEALRNHGAVQKSATQSRPVSTQQRIALQNEVWDIISNLRTAAQVVFRTDPARSGIFQLYPSKKKKEEG